MPDVPMFTSSPAKRPRREAIADTLTAVGQTIATVLHWLQKRALQQMTWLQLNRYLRACRSNKKISIIHCMCNIHNTLICFMSNFIAP